MDNPVVFVIVYWPTLVNKDFLREFAKFLGEIFTNYDRNLIMGDFNIHVCCDSKLLSKECLSLLDTLDFLQWVSGPTHVQSHTLDLISSHGLTVLDINIYDAGLSDHMPMLFSIQLDGKIQRHSPLPRWTRIIIDRSGEEFPSMYVHLNANQDIIGRYTTGLF